MCLPPLDKLHKGNNKKQSKWKQISEKAVSVFSLNKPEAQMSYSDQKLSVVLCCHRRRRWLRRHLSSNELLSFVVVVVGGGIGFVSIVSTVNFSDFGHWAKGIEVCSIEGPNPFPRVDKSKIVLLKISKNLLLQNQLAYYNQTCHKASLGKGDSVLFKWRDIPFSEGR